MSIREVNAVAITDAVEELCIRANTQLPPDVKQVLDNAHAAEPWPLARQTLELLQQNLCVAAEKDLPICQDTGMACVDRKSTRLNSSHDRQSRMPSSA